MWWLTWTYEPPINSHPKFRVWHLRLLMFTFTIIIDDGTYIEAEYAEEVIEVPVDHGDML